MIVIIIVRTPTHAVQIEMIGLEGSESQLRMDVRQSWITLASLPGTVAV
jgi:hypothetical protein